MALKKKVAAKGKIGSSFDDFLAEQGILRECEEQAIKQILAEQITAAMERDRLTKAAMAARMQTSRRALDRLLDPRIPALRCAHYSAPRRPSAANFGLSLFERTELVAAAKLEIAVDSTKGAGNPSRSHRMRELGAT